MPLPRGQNLMHPVPQFMGQGHHVAGAALVVQQQIGMRRRHGRMGEGARRLARAHRRVDPGVVEEALADIGHLRRECGIGAEDRLAGLVPVDAAFVDIGQRRVAIPVIQPVGAEPFRLQRIIAMRQVRTGRPHCRGKSVHHLVLDEIGQVSRRIRPREFAPAVLDMLVLGKRVGDQRQRADIGAQHLADDLRRVAAGRRVRVGQQVEDLRLGTVLAAERKPQPRHGLVEQPDPGRPPDHRFLVQDALDLVVEQMRPHGALVAQPWPVPREVRILQ